MPLSHHHHHQFNRGRHASTIIMAHDDSNPPPTHGDPTALPPLPLPAGITSRFVDTRPFGLRYHVLEAIPAASSSSSASESEPAPRPPLVLLLHGFPNLAYDWRFVMPGLARAGYYAVAFDLRGFGRTHDGGGAVSGASGSSGSSGAAAAQQQQKQQLLPRDGSFSADGFTPLAMVRDVVALVHALGYSSVHTLVGHDLGAFAAAVCALARRDLIQSLVLMAHPFRGAPKAPFGTAASASLPAPDIPPTNRFDTLRDPDVHTSLQALDPPRQHYKWYNGAPGAAAEWSYPQDGPPLREFLRGYFHLKSGACRDGGGGKPRPLGAWTAECLAVMPHYYIMRAGVSMRENVALDMAAEREAAGAANDEDKEKAKNWPPAPEWLTERDLDVYTAEWSRTTFADALRWYASLTGNPAATAELRALASGRIAVPTRYVSGAKDWGTYQDPGALEAMEEGESVERGCYTGTVLLEGAGHWVNMERPGACVREILHVAAMV